MGLNFRKSIKIAPGIRVNISKKGLSSVSVGGKGARVNVSKKGTRTTVGLRVLVFLIQQIPATRSQKGL